MTNVTLIVGDSFQQGQGHDTLQYARHNPVVTNTVATGVICSSWSGCAAAKWPESRRLRHGTGGAHYADRLMSIGCENLREVR